MANLVIVESPAKAKTIEKYLGKDYKVLATVGHIIDLPKNRIAVDFEHAYKPEFVTIKGKGEVIKKLKKAVPKKGDVYLAMDPDREGEAIAWHTADALKLKSPKRVVFHEITKDAVLTAISKPTKIDQDLVQAQIARRVLDRVVGYQVSQLLWEKIWYGLSAGRVQSVALRLIVEREEEIEAFVPKEFWDVFVILEEKEKKKVKVKAQLSKLDGKKFVPTNEKEVLDIEDDVKKKDFSVFDVEKKESKKYPYPPFTTSTLQQAANNVLGFSSKRTMALAQILYQSGYITYMRTDSVNLSNQAINAIRGMVKEKYGEKYLPEKPNFYKNKARNAQEAHEAIRPSDFGVSTEAVKAKFGPAEAKLYDLILKRAVASQMSPKIAEVLNITFRVEGKSKKTYDFLVKAEKVLFDGFTKVMSSKFADESEFQEVSDIEKRELFSQKEFLKEQKFTKPKARYTEATLIKTLEKYGIGRPSTYSSIISTVQDRGYVIKVQRYLIPQDVGRVVNALMKSSFERLVDYEYTAGVENGLDDMAEGKMKYEPFVDKEYKLLQKELKKAKSDVKKEDIVILGKSDEKCPDCKGKMVERLGRYGKFLSCAKFPECKGMKGLNIEEDLDMEKYLKPKECPKCKKKMILKIGKYGKFWACEDYPNCKGVVSLLLHEKCPECKSPLVERKGKWGKTFTGCSGYPKCKYIKKEKSSKKAKKK
jgi:DNA topoisomerase I